MSELGRLLREAREAKKQTLAEVEAATRIRQKYLEALESGEFAKLPRGTVARGFLRTYAAYLELDEQAMLELYKSESGDQGEEVPIAEPGKPRLADYRPLEVELIDSVPRSPWWPWLVALVVVAGLAAAGWWWLSQNPGFDPLAAFGPAPTATPTQTPAQTPTPVIITVTPKPTETAVPPTPTSSLLPLPTPTVPASPTPTPRPSATPEIVARIALELLTSQPTWVRVVVDGQLIEEGLLEANVSRAWEASVSITLRTGNAGGVVLRLNGEDLGPMGEIGQVVERTWIIEQGEVTETIELTPTPTQTPEMTSTPGPEPSPTETPAG